MLLQKSQNSKKALSKAIASFSDDVEPLIVVYELQKGEWRGFVWPYGETTEASTKKQALTKIRALATGYRDIVKKYNNPTHLVYGGLGELSDLEVFAGVVGNKSIMDEIHKKEGKVDQLHLYVEAYRNKS